VRPEPAIGNHAIRGSEAVINAEAHRGGDRIMDQESRPKLSEPPPASPLDDEGDREGALHGGGGRLLIRLQGLGGRRVSRALPVVGLLVLLLLTALSVQPLAAQHPNPDATPAFAIPSSDLVFSGVLTLNGIDVEFGAREGALILVDTPDDPLSLGLVLTLDRDGRFGSKKESVLVHAWRIEPNPAGGESMTHIDLNGEEPGGATGGAYGERITLEGKLGEDEPKLGAVDVVVSSDHFEDFHDAGLVTALWEAARRDQNAFRGLYHQLYAIYGPGAGACTLCNEILVCSTSLRSCADDAR
jgi:hypothetical protein